METHTLLCVTDSMLLQCIAPLLLHHVTKQWILHTKPSSWLSIQILPVEIDEKERNRLLETEEYQMRMEESPFLYLTCDLPQPPLFKDEKKENIIPQVRMFCQFLCGLVVGPYNIVTQSNPCYPALVGNCIFHMVVLHSHKHSTLSSNQPYICIGITYANTLKRKEIKTKQHKNKIRWQHLLMWCVQYFPCVQLQVHI